MQPLKTLVTLVAAATLSTPAVGQSCAERLNLSSPASEIIECLKAQSNELSETKALLGQAEDHAEVLNATNRRLVCAKLALDVALKRTLSNREYVALAAGTYANHGVRNSMLQEWRSSRIPSADEKFQEVADYLSGKRQGC